MNPNMKRHGFNRRQFVQTSAALAGAAVLSPWALSNARAAAQAVKRSATDQVTLGKTGLKLSRLGFGTGAQGASQRSLGKETFIKLVHYAYDHGITYLDCADRYQTFDWMGDVIKGLPREKLFIQSKIAGQPPDVLAAVDLHRKNFNTDYIDSLLIHNMSSGTWTDTYKRVMDGFDQAKEKKWIRAKGVSCHTLPALRAGIASDWTEVHLVRVNPQGKFTDGESGNGFSPQTTYDIAPVLQQIKIMREKGRGVIAMKLIGNGLFTDPADREKSIRFAMACKDIDAAVIGFTSTGQVDEAIERINRALAEA
jgi:aryl-alcohol dehydrogenase-like predicted oxidoreductase